MEHGMKTEKRWMKTVQAEAAACKTRMPWERGLRRQAMIRRRSEDTPAPLATARWTPRAASA